MIIIYQDQGNFNLVDAIPNLRRAASTGGGEWCGPCPACGGVDRFRCWPSRGRFWCRQCDWRGDSIQFLRDRAGFSFRAAKAAVRGTSSDYACPVRNPAARAEATKAARRRAAFEDWTYRRSLELRDNYSDTGLQLYTARIARRFIRRNPGKLTDCEAGWWLRHCDL